MKIKNKSFLPLISILVLTAAFSLTFALTLTCSNRTKTAGQDLNAGWEISLPEEQGIDSAPLAEMLEKINTENLKVRSVIIARNGKLVLEAYVHPYNRNTAHDVKSVSKSIISALTGIAVEKKILQSIDQKVYEFLPEYFSDEEPQKKNISLRHLLMMASGLDLDENGPKMREIMSQENWLEETYSRPLISSPGMKFTYSTLLSHTLSAVLTKAAGISTFEFGNAHLFEKLGMKQIYWDKDKFGICLGGDKLWMRPIDMAKFGQLYLNNGEWNGEQVIPEKWIKESLKNYYTDFDHDGFDGYGYMWWHLKDMGIHARGMGGQIISLYPEKNMTVVFTGGHNGHWYQLTKDLILPAVKGNKLLPENKTDNKRLEKIIKELESPDPLEPRPLPETAKRIAGQKYILKENGLEFSDITLNFDGSDSCSLEIGYNQKILNLAAGLDNVYRVTSNAGWGMKAEGNSLALKGKWSEEKKFLVDFHEVGEPFYFDIDFSFKGDSVFAAFAWQPINWQFQLRGVLGN